MADDTLTAVLSGTLLSVATVAVGHLYRRVHELRDRIRDLEDDLAALRPIIQAIRKATGQQAVALFRRGGRRG